MSRSWFQELTGFDEETPDQVRANLKIEGETIVSKVNGRKMRFGRFETPTLAQLRTLASAIVPDGDPVTIEEVVGDVQALHAQLQSHGALFQVASQFNLLEMVSPSVTPEAGISIYAHDHTQGPACAIAAGAGTIYRNYFAPVSGQIGQTKDHQIDCLATLGDALGNKCDRLWSMDNGYALASEGGLKEICKQLANIDDIEIDDLRGTLRIGLQWDTEVTINNSGHQVTQAFCSGLPVAYSAHSPDLWEPFARLVLDATYEGTLAAAIINHSITGNNLVYLTLIGGGAFGNRVDWIVSAIQRALDLFRRHSLDVKIVSYGRPNPHLNAIF